MFFNIFNKKEKDPFLRLVGHVKRENIVILSCLNKNYLFMFRIWKDFFIKHGRKNLIIISLDRETHNEVQSYGFNSFFHDAENINKSELWNIRLDYIARAIKSGVHVIQTDLDAFWFKDIIPFLDDYKGDLFISRGGGLPKSVVEVWGFCLCCGFFMLKSNKRTKSFISKWIKLVEEKKDDQVALNEYFLENEIKWEHLENGDSYGYVDNLKIIKINTKVISRVLRKELSIFHIHLPDNRSKLEELERQFPFEVREHFLSN